MHSTPSEQEWSYWAWMFRPMAEFFVFNMVLGCNHAMAEGAD